MIFSLDDLSIADSGILKSPAVIVLLSLSPFNIITDNIFSCANVGCIYIHSGYIFLMWTFPYYVMTLFVSYYCFWLKLYFVSGKYVQARLQPYVNCELLDVQAGFRKGRGTRDQTAKICWIIEKATEHQKYIYFCFIYYAKAFGCVDHNKLWKILKEMGIQTTWSAFLYADQEATVRTGHGTTDWFQIGKGVCQGCILSPCLFNLYAEYIMRNTGMDEAQAGIKTAKRNISNLRYADDTMIESKEQLLDESERGEWKCWLKTQHSKN